MGKKIHLVSLTGRAVALTRSAAVIYFNCLYALTLETLAPLLGSGLFTLSINSFPDSSSEQGRQR